MGPVNCARVNSELFLQLCRSGPRVGPINYVGVDPELFSQLCQGGPVWDPLIVSE